MNKTGIFLSTFLATLILSAPVFAGPQHSAGGFRSGGAGFRSSSRSGPGMGRSAGAYHYWNGSNARFAGSRAGFGTASSRAWQGRGFRGVAGSGFRHHHHDRDFIFVGDFGFPFYDPFFGYYPYGYYPYGYYGYGYPPYGYDDGAYTQGVYQGKAGYPGDSDYYGDTQGYDRPLVARVQRQLARNGYYKGEIDGVPGRRTYYAIRSFQRDHDLRVDGAISDRLLNEMGLR